MIFRSACLWRCFLPSPLALLSIRILCRVTVVCSSDLKLCAVSPYYPVPDTNGVSIDCLYPSMHFAISPCAFPILILHGLCVVFMFVAIYLAISVLKIDPHADAAWHKCRFALFVWKLCAISAVFSVCAPAWTGCRLSIQNEAFCNVCSRCPAF